MEILKRLGGLLTRRPEVPRSEVLHRIPQESSSTFVPGEIVIRSDFFQTLHRESPELGRLVRDLVIYESQLS